MNRHYAPVEVRAGVIAAATLPIHKLHLKTLAPTYFSGRYGVSTIL